MAGSWSTRATGPTRPVWPTASNTSSRSASAVAPENAWPLFASSASTTATTTATPSSRGSIFAALARSRSTGRPFRTTNAPSERLRPECRICCRAKESSVSEMSSRRDSPSYRTKSKGLTTVLALCCAVATGVLGGLGAFTFGYGDGAAYLQNDPQSCANCHVMQPQLDSWTKSSHKAVATCNDCHLPPRLRRQVDHESRQRFLPLPGVHDERLSRPDPDQTPQPASDPGRVPLLPRGLRALHAARGNRRRHADVCSLPRRCRARRARIGIRRERLTVLPTPRATP